MPDKIGPFEVERKLGIGGMGIVYLANWPARNMKVALKVLTPALSEDEKLLKRFEREIAILKRLRHEHIVRYYGGGKYRNQRYYAMEVVNGGSIDEIIEKRGQLPWEEAVDYAIQLCHALEYAHANQIIHRDLKPANLFLTKTGQLKLGDFGIARDQDATALTADGRTVGTYAYMAPEQITGEPPVSGKTDLYATGCLLFEMLAGRTPFVADNPAEMLMKHVKKKPPSVRQYNLDCPIWLDKLIIRLLEKSPEDRPFDALVVQADLQEVKKHAATHAGVVQQSTLGGATQLTVVNEQDRSDLKKILGTKKKKKKKKQSGSIFDSTPFLVGAMVAILALGWWLMRPLTEPEIMARVDELMAADDPVEWGKARRQYIDPYLEDYPQGEFVNEMRQHALTIDVDIKRRQLFTRIKTGQAPQTEAERIFGDAYQYEQFGDRLTALDRYRSLITLYQEVKEEKILVALAREQIKEIESTPDAGGRLKIVNERLKSADADLLRGNQIAAETKWRSIIVLYNDNREFARHVKYARARLDGKEVPPFDFGDGGNSTGGE